MCSGDRDFVFDPKNAPGQAGAVQLDLFELSGKSIIFNLRFKKNVGNSVTN